MAQPGTVQLFAYDTYSTDDWSNQLGLVGSAPDADTTSSGTTQNSNGLRELVLVYNDSGATLPAGASLKFSSGQYGKKVVKGTTGVPIRAFVPPVINGSATGTIAIGAYFWAVRRGFTSVLKSTANVAEGDQIENSATAGQTKSNTGTAYSGVLAGTFIAADDSGDATTVRAYANCEW